MAGVLEPHHVDPMMQPLWLGFLALPDVLMAVYGCLPDEASALAHGAATAAWAGSSASPVPESDAGP